MCGSIYCCLAVRGRLPLLLLPNLLAFLPFANEDDALNSYGNTASMMEPPASPHPIRPGYRCRAVTGREWLLLPKPLASTPPARADAAP